MTLQNPSQNNAKNFKTTIYDFGCEISGLGADPISENRENVQPCPLTRLRQLSLLRSCDFC